MGVSPASCTGHSSAFLGPTVRILKKIRHAEPSLLPEELGLYQAPGSGRVLGFTWRGYKSQKTRCGGLFCLVPVCQLAIVLSPVLFRRRAEPLQA